MIFRTKRTLRRIVIDAEVVNGQKTPILVYKENKQNVVGAE